MRISRARTRKLSTRRPHRPDQRVYRSLRRAGQRRGVTAAGAWVGAAVLVAAVLAVMLVRWAMR